jgi:hypothetical protein
MSKHSKKEENQGADMAAQQVYQNLIAKGFISCLSIVQMIMDNKFKELDFGNTDSKVVKVFTDLHKRLNKEHEMPKTTTATKKVTKKVTAKKPVAKKTSSSYSAKTSPAKKVSAKKAVARTK